jgi:hypothetical protein
MPQPRGVDGAVVSEDHIPLLQYCLVRHLVDLVECKSVWVVGLEFADGFVGCEAAKSDKYALSCSWVSCWATDEGRAVRVRTLPRVSPSDSTLCDRADFAAQVSVARDRLHSVGRSRGICYWWALRDTRRYRGLPARATYPARRCPVNVVAHPVLEYIVATMAALDTCLDALARAIQLSSLPGSTCNSAMSLHRHPGPLLV